MHDGQLYFFLTIGTRALRAVPLRWGAPLSFPRFRRAGVAFSQRKSVGVLFGRHDAKRRTTVGLIRDVVEVVAIVAAGAWAFYIFAYENRIKPSWASPEVNFTATMQRLGERNGLIAVRVHQTMHNFGTVPANFWASR